MQTALYFGFVCKAICIYNSLKTKSVLFQIKIDKVDKDNNEFQN